MRVATVSLFEKPVTWLFLFPPVVYVRDKTQLVEGSRCFCQRADVFDGGCFLRAPRNPTIAAIMGSEGVPNLQARAVIPSKKEGVRGGCFLRTPRNPTIAAIIGFEGVPNLQPGSLC